METKRVFVTGATGFIGRYLVGRLGRRGHIVTCLIRNPKKTRGFSDIGLRFVKGDLMDIEKLKKHIRGQDVVFHLAAIRGEWKFPWETYYKVNVEATRRLAEFSAHAEVSKFVYVSSVGVLGTSPLQVPADEKTPYNPDGYYHRSKMLAERAVLRRTKSLTTVIIRPTITYGPRDTGFLYRIMRIMRTGFFPIVGHGDNKVHILYVKGLVEALMNAMEVQCATGQIYTVADSSPLELRNLVQVVANTFRKVTIINVPCEPFMRLAKVYDATIVPIVKGTSTLISFKLLSLPWFYSVEKAVKEIGYQPYRTEEMVKDTVAWYVKHGLC